MSADLFRLNLFRLRAAPAAARLPAITVSDDGRVRHLHLGTPWIQGSMRIARPFAIELEYVQRMMAWLLFAPQPLTAHSFAGQHAMQLGLGAGAITKFCHHALRMRCTAIELNPQVLAVCRNWFKLPPDGAALRVLLADAAQEIRRSAWHGTVDALAVDLYDDQSAAPVLNSAAFYADCRTLLAPGGIMTVNLFGRHCSYAHSVDCLREAFGAQALWAFSATREGNTVVLAQRNAQALDARQMEAACAQVQQLWGLPTGRWARALGKL